MEYNQIVNKLACEIIADNAVEKVACANDKRLESGSASMKEAMSENELVEKIACDIIEMALEK